MLQNVNLDFLSDIKGSKGTAKQIINQLQINSNTYSNINIKQFNQLHNQRTTNDFHSKETSSKNRRRYS